MTEEEERMVFIVNPKSAAGSTLRRFERFRDRYGASLGAFDVKLTSGAGDATHLTRESLEEAKQEGASCKIISVGGDGTMNEVVNGFFCPDAQPVSPGSKLAIFPSGTGGDFPRTYDWSRDLDASFRRIRNGADESVDVGRARMTGFEGEEIVRYFLNIGSFGLSGAVDQVVNRSSKALGARLSFVFGTVRAFMDFESPKVEITIDENQPFEEEISLVAVANGQYFGGGMWIAPQASPSDGLFHVVTVRGTRKRFWLQNAWKVYSGTHLSLEEVRTDTGREISAKPIDGRNPVLIDLDGEQPGCLPANFRILPGALRLIV